MSNPSVPLSASSVKLRLLTTLTQELLTPLTSMMGMASVLKQEIYGSLTPKQREYVDIIYHNSRLLQSLVEEIQTLAQLEEGAASLQQTTTDLDALCHQMVAALQPMAIRREQKINISIEPGHQTWLLDREKVQQMLHHLLISVMLSVGAGSVIHLQVSRQQPGVEIRVGSTENWLGNSFPQAELQCNQVWSPATLTDDVTLSFAKMAALMSPQFSEDVGIANSNSIRERLGLLLSCQLAEIHGGQFSVKKLLPSGYQYLLTLLGNHGIGNNGNNGGL